MSKGIQETSNSMQLDQASQAILRDFFNPHHDKLLCTSNALGQPDAALMGTPRLEADSTIRFTISEAASVSLRNIRENRRVLFVAYDPGDRARDYVGVRISATVRDLITDGSQFDAVREQIAQKHGPAKAQTLQAVLVCVIEQVRPIVDRGQHWIEAML